MSVLDQIRAIRERRDRATLLFEAYDTVRAHILPKLNPDSITVTMLDEQRHLLSLELASLRNQTNELRAKCAHAWERIGEAKPPFWQCVRCLQTVSSNPVSPR